MSRLLVLALAVWLGLGHGGFAQDAGPLPGPDEPVEPAQPVEPLEEQAIAGVASGPRQPSWWTTLRVASGYDSNVDLTPTEAARDDFPSELLASLHGELHRSDTRLTLQLDGGGTHYARLSEFDAPILGGSFNFEAAPGARALFVLRGDYRRDYVRSIVRLVDAGLVPGKVLTSAYAGAASIELELAPRFSAVADASYDRVSYDDDALPAGDTLSLGGGLAWEVSETERVDLSYVHRWTESGTDEGRSHQVVLSWDRRLSAKLDAGLSAGISRDRPLGSLETVTPWSLGARLAGVHGRHRLDASYRRSLDQAYGLGRSLLFNAGAFGETYAVTPRLDASVRGALSRGEDPIDDSYRLDGRSLTAELALRVSPRVTVGASFSYVSTQETNRPEITSYVVELSLAHRKPWR